MKTFLVSLFFLSPIIGLGNTAPTDNSKEQISTMLPSLEYSPSEIRFARELIDLINSTRRNQRNPRATQNLLNLRSQTELFADFIPLIEKARLVHQGNLTAQNYFSRCQLPSTLIAVPPSDILYANLFNFCIQQFSRIHRNRKLNREETNFVIQNIATFLSARHQDDFVNLISSLSKDIEYHKEIFQVISEHLIAKSMLPSTDLIRAMPETAEFTHFLQTLGHTDPRNQRLFTQEVIDMVQSTRKLTQGEKFGESLSSAKTLIHFFGHNKNFIDVDRAARNMRLIIEDFIRASQFAKAKELAKLYAHFFGGTGEEEGFYFQALWADIIRQNYNEAMKTINTLSLLEKRDLFTNRIMYWIAHALEQQKHTNQALQIYTDILEKTPLSYYAVLSSKKINQLQANSRQVSRFLASSVDAPPAHVKLQLTDYTSHFIHAAQRISIWSDLGMGHWAYEEAIFLLNSGIQNIIANQEVLTQGPLPALERQVTRTFAEIFNSKGEYLQTFRILGNALSNGSSTLSDLNLNQLFPLAYLPEINRHKGDIDPVLILALIRQESAFNPTARSSAGARGLMQLMPQTARTMQRGIQASQLENPDTNIRLGIRYFRNRLNQFEGDLILTLASYNAGMHRVRRWQREVFITQEPLKLIESIPFNETQNYVKLIYRNIFFYRLLQDQINLDQSIPDSFRVSLAPTTR